MFLLLTIPLVAVSMETKLLENAMFFLLTIPLVTVSIAMKLFENVMFCF